MSKGTLQPVIMTPKEIQVLHQACKAAGVDATKISATNPFKKSGLTASLLQAAVSEFAPEQAAKWRIDAGQGLSVATMAEIQSGGELSQSAMQDRSNHDPDFVADESQDPEQDLMLEELTRGLAYLKHQCPDEAELLELKVLDGFTNREIGEACGSNREVTRRNWHAAKEKLRSHAPDLRALIAS